MKKYEGYHSNGAKNGKGTEHCHGGTTPFEGTHKNGKKIEETDETVKYDFSEYRPYSKYSELENEKGIECYGNGKIHFQGEFFEGLKWNGITYNYNGEKEFEITNGNGFGNEWDEIEKYNIYFKGNYLKGEKSGKGEECILF